MSCFGIETHGRMYLSLHLEWRRTLLTVAQQAFRVHTPARFLTTQAQDGTDGLLPSVES